LGVQLEVAGTILQVDPWRRYAFRPAEGPPHLELVQYVLGQRDGSDQIGMLTVVEQVVIKDSVRAGTGKSRGTGHYERAATACHGMEGHLKIRRAAQRQSIKVARHDELGPGLLPVFDAGELLGEAVVALGKFRMLFHQSAKCRR